MNCFSCPKVFFMKKSLLLSACLLAVSLSYGQSDKNFTHYMSDQISFNPAATGFKGFCGTVLYRNQWLGFRGAPETFLFNAQGNIEKLSMGVGISFMNDNAGQFIENDFKVTAAKYFEIVGAGYLSLGLGVGIINGGFIPNWIAPDTGPDASKDVNLPGAETQTKLDLNAGIFWRDINENYYLGVSTTHLAQPTFDKITFVKNRQYYATGGLNIGYSMWNALGSDLTLKPSFLVISDLVTTSPEFTLIADYQLLPQQSVYAGVAWRTRDAFSILAGMGLDITPKSVPNKSNLGSLGGDADVLNIGVAYDINTVAYNNVSNGTLEFWANYCIFPVDPAVARYGNPFILQ